MTLPGDGYFDIPWEGFRGLEQEGLLSIRVRGASLLRHWNFEEDFTKLKELRKKYCSDRVKLIAAKIFADGIIGNETAYLLEPYNNKPDYYAEAYWPQDALNQAYAAVNRERLQVHNHTDGDGAVRMSLDAAEYADINAPGFDCRNAMTHLVLVSESDIPRFGKLNVIAIPQTYWHFKQPGAWGPIERPALGERAEKMYPLKSFTKTGATVAFSSDYPVTTIPLPFCAIEIAVTRNLPDAAAYGAPYDITDIDDPKYLLWPEERLDIKNAIRGFTINAAYSIFAENVTGSLEVGKSADLVVIDQDLFSIDPLKISDTHILRTYFNGRLVHSIAGNR